MAALNPKQHLEAAIRSNQQRLINDLKAIPAEKQNECPGGCSRTALNIVAECGMVNGFIAAYLRGESGPRPSPEERNAFLASFDTEEKSVTYLQEQTDKLLEAIGALDESVLGDDDSNFFGRPMTKFAIAELPAMHMSYHDGQLNYIHTLNNDSAVHW
ncbi:MAG: hypothetical protein OHK0029_30000 [Armatimonadaceae bacterium]